ncbi:hypothetical protein EC988_006649, partial [Linderina pennispora]
MDEATKELLGEHTKRVEAKPQWPSLQRIIIAIAAAVVLVAGVAIFSQSLPDCLMSQPVHALGRIHAGKVFFKIPSPKHLKHHLEMLTSSTHFGGRDYEAGKYTQAVFAQCGIEAKAVEYYPWVGMPTDQQVV